MEPLLDILEALTLETIQEMVFYIQIATCRNSVKPLTAYINNAIYCAAKGHLWCTLSPVRWVKDHAVAKILGIKSSDEDNLYNVLAAPVAEPFWTL